MNTVKQEYTRPTKEEATKLVETHIKLAYTKASYYTQNTGFEYDDILSHALEGLFKATRSYDATKGTFYTYASRAIDTHIFKFLNVKRNRLKKSNITAFTPYKDVTESSYVDVESFVGKIRNKLDGDDLKLFLMITDSNKKNFSNLEKIGQAFNITAQGAKRRIDMLKIKIKAEM